MSVDQDKLAELKAKIATYSTEALLGVIAEIDGLNPTLSEDRYRIIHEHVSNELRSRQPA